MRIFYTLLGIFFITVFVLISMTIAVNHSFGNRFIFIILIGAGWLLGDLIKEFIEGN